MLLAGDTHGGFQSLSVQGMKMRILVNPCIIEDLDSIGMNYHCKGGEWECWLTLA